jgi:hypothetical protein
MNGFEFQEDDNIDPDAMNIYSRRYLARFIPALDKENLRNVSFYSEVFAQIFDQSTTNVYFSTVPMHLRLITLVVHLFNVLKVIAFKFFKR